MKHKRRNFMALAAASLASGTLFSSAADLLVTPSQTAGPFYPDTLPLDTDNDLTQVAGSQLKAKGIICNVYGLLQDRHGQPIVGAKVEIWQCDANGRYRHSGDTHDAPMDEGFQGYGVTETDDDGRYRFRTIKPVAYPGRTPHIHYQVKTLGGDQLITQMYVEGDAGNLHDGLFKRVGSQQRQRLVSAQFVVNPDDSAELMARWDIVMG